MKKVPCFFCFVFLLTSCVSKKVYTDLQTKYRHLQKEKSALFERYDHLLLDAHKKKTTIENLKEKQIQQSQKQSAQSEKLKNLQQAYSKLQTSYNLLSDKSSGLLAKNAQQNSLLLEKLSEKQIVLSSVPPLLFL